MTSPLRATQPQRAPEPRRSPHPKPYLRVAPEPYRRRRTAIAVVVVAVVVFGSLLASAVFQSVLVRGQLHLDDVHRRTERTRLAVTRDRVQVAKLQSPARLEATAARMGMVPATRSFAVGPGPDAPVATGTPPTDDGDDPSATSDMSDSSDKTDDGDTAAATTVPVPSTKTATSDARLPSQPTGRERATGGPRGPVR